MKFESHTRFRETTFLSDNDLYTSLREDFCMQQDIANPKTGGSCSQVSHRCMTRQLRSGEYGKVGLYRRRNACHTSI